MKEESKKSVAGQYNKYMPEERASIGKYTAENGSTKAARCFSKLLKRDINESTARKLRSVYLKELAASTKGDHSTASTSQIVALPKKSQGRPLLLGIEFDTIVQGYVRGLRTTKAIVNTRIVMAVAEGVLLSKDP